MPGEQENCPEYVSDLKMKPRGQEETGLEDTSHGSEFNFTENYSSQHQDRSSERPDTTIPERGTQCLPERDGEATGEGCDNREENG